MKTLNFIVSLPSSNPYQQEQAAEAVAIARQSGADVQILHADSDAVTQSQQILEAIQSRTAARPDAVLVEPLTSTGLARVADAAVAADIAWVVLNADVDYMEALRGRAQVPVFTVTRDHTEIGRMQGRQFAALLPTGGTVLYLQGPANSSAATQRTIGMESTKPKNITIRSLRCQWSDSDAHKIVSAWLRLSTSRAETTQLVGCQYDGIAMGARRAFQEVTDLRERERWLHLPFTGVDGLPKEGRAWVDEGLLAATVVAPATTGTGIQLLLHALETGTAPAARTLIELRSYPPLEKLTPRQSPLRS
jgi:ribose transport system substrate-binding protein